MIVDKDVLRDLSEVIQDGTWQKLSWRARLIALVIKFHIGWKKEFPSAEQLQEYAKLSKLSFAKALA